MLTLLIWGARISLFVGLIATLISMVIGTVIGLTSGYFGGWVGAILFRLTEWFLVIPFLPLAIVLATVLGRGLVNIVIVIGVTSWPGTALLIRSQMLSIKERPYLERARALGAGTRHLITQHVLPNVMPMVFANTTLTVAVAILSETTLQLPRPRRPDPGLVGLDARRRLQRRRDHHRLLVVLRAARRLRGAGRARLHPGRPGPRRGPQPEAEGAAMSDRHLLASSRRAAPARLSSRSATSTSPTDRDEGGLPAVRGVDLAVERGEIVGVAGESGCGKSTLASTILRLQPPSATVTGEVLVDGEDVLTMRWGDLRAVRWAGASIVFQGALHSLNPVHRIGDQIAEPIQLHEPGLSDARRTVARRRAARAGRPAGPERARSYPHQLSGGQRQRVMIAMALACDPRLVVADEPTTALDVMVQAQVLDVLSTLVRELGVGMMLISHDLSVLADLCDRIAVMYAGRVVEPGPADQLFAAPAAPLHRRALGVVPAGRRPGGALRPGRAAGRPARPAQPAPGLLVPPALPACRGRVHDGRAGAGDVRRAADQAACVRIGQ